MQDGIIYTSLSAIPSTNCRISTVVPPDEGHGEVRNM